MPPPKGPEIIRNPLTLYVSSITLPVIFICQVLIINFIHKWLLKTDVEVKIVHLLFFVLALVLPNIFLLPNYQAAWDIRSQCQTEIALGDHGIRCARNEDFGKGVFVLFMMLAYILVLISVSLFTNLRTLNLKPKEYKKFLMKTSMVLFLLGIIFTGIYWILFITIESKRPQIINPGERSYTFRPVTLPSPSQKILNLNKEIR